MHPLLVRLTSHTLAASVASGFLLGVAFVHPFFWWSALLGLTWLLLLLKRCRSVATAVRIGLVAGTIKAACAVGWFWSVYPIDWLGVTDRTLQFVGIGWIWFTVSLSIGIGFVLFAVLARYLLLATGRFWVLLVPPLLVLSELAGSLVFSLYSLGAESSLNVHFSFGYLGYTIARHGVLSLFAFLGGAYVLSLVVGIVALLLYLALEARFYRGGLAVAGVLCMSYFAPQSYLAVAPTQSVVAVNTAYKIQSTMSEEELAERAGTLREALTAALQSGSGTIVFPETANALSSFASPMDVFAYANERAPEGVTIIDSVPVEERAGVRYHIRADVYDGKAGVVYHTYKNYLVPTGEFLPYSVAFAIKLAGFQGVAETLDERMNYKSGSGGDAESVPATLPGVLFCSESLSPIGTELATRGQQVPLIVHPVSHAWFHTPHSLWYQLDLMLRTQVRAVRVPLVQASNMSLPVAYNRYGLPVTGEVIFVHKEVLGLRYEL